MSEAEQFDTAPPDPGTPDERCGRFNPHPAHRWTQRPQMEARWCPGVAPAEPPPPTPGQAHALLRALRLEQRRRRKGDTPADAARTLAAEQKRQRRRARNLIRG